MRLEMLGAVGGEVTGSAFAVTNKKGNKKILVECGLFQSKKNDERNYSLNSHDPNQFDAVFNTHAHLDHTGKLPYLAKTKADIYMTPPTKPLTKIILENSEDLSPKLYAPGSVKDVLKKIICVPYGKSISVDGLTATFRDAGHMLGSSSLELLEEYGDLVVFSGDLGNNSSRTVNPGTPIKEANVVVMETTYGDRIHPEEDPINIIKEAIKRIKKTDGTLLIPAFAVDRTQTILSILRELSKTGKLGIPVYLDSPMAIKATSVYTDYYRLLNENLGKNPFKFPGLINTFESSESRQISEDGPKIIIAGGGMMSGGRIMNHAAKYLSDPKSVILFVGFATKGSIGRAIIEGEKNIKIRGKSVPINGTVLQTSGLSAHADQRRLLEWLRHIQGGKRYLRKVILVHGNDAARNEFANLIKIELGIKNVSLPKENDPIDLESNN